MLKMPQAPSANVAAKRTRQDLKTSMGPVAIRRIGGVFTSAEIKTHGFPYFDRLRLELGPHVRIVTERLTCRAPTGTPSNLKLD